MADRTVPGDFPTIHTAVQASNDEGGDTVTVSPGTYNETISLISPSGGWLIPVTIRASDPSNKPVITSTGAIQAVLANSIMKGTSAGLPVFENLVFEGWDAATNGVLNFVADPTLRGCALRVTGCEFTGNTGQRCVRLVATVASQGIVEQCRFETSGDAGSPIIARGSDNTIIRNNLFFPGVDAPCEEGAFTSNTYVINNSVYGEYNNGAINVMAGAGFYNNNAIQNTGTGAAHGIDATAGTYTDNLVFGTFTTDYAGTDGGGNDTGLDPEYRDPGAGDLTTPDTSPCYRTAARSASALLTYTGTSRSDPTDKGAYEEPDALPDFADAEMTAPLIVRCTWTEAMIDNAALVLASNYSVSGVTPASVTRINATTVDLTMTARIQESVATVTSSGPQDLAGQAADGATINFVVPYLTLVEGEIAAGRTSIEVVFNVAATSGYAAVGDWTVEPRALGATVSVTGVTSADGVTVALDVYPECSGGATYRVTAVNAANAAGPVGDD